MRKRKGRAHRYSGGGCAMSSLMLSLILPQKYSRSSSDMPDPIWMQPRQEELAGRQAAWGRAGLERAGAAWIQVCKWTAAEVAGAMARRVFGLHQLPCMP